MLSLAAHIDKLMRPDGIICIEGKGPDDKKIRRSKIVEGNLAIDEFEHGHLRRIWTKEWAEMMCRTFNWEIVDLSDIQENITNGGRANFLRLLARNK